MNFALFVLLHAILMIRPEELVPGIAGLRLYLIVIVFCVLTTMSGVLAQLTPRSLRERPITACALGFFGAMALSQIVRGNLDVLTGAVPEFAKVLLYFLLLMAVVNTPERLITVTGWIVAFVVVLSTVGVLRMHGVIDVEAIQPVKQYMGTVDEETGAPDYIYRLVSTGIYNDPNDLCLVLSTGIICCLCRAAFARNLLTRGLWLAPIVWFGYAMHLTHSRGGLLGLGAGLVAFIYARYGARKTLPLTLLCVPALLLAFGGRQTDFNLSGNDTSQERMRLWAEGLNAMLGDPVATCAGIGVGQYHELSGLVAHNSFVHAYVETGMLGGTLFLGMFFLAFLGVWRSGRDGVLDGDETMIRLRPFVFALVAAYAAGAYSVSRNYVVPTYMILGLAGAFVRMAYHEETPAWFCFDGRMAKRLAVAGVIGLVFLKLFTQSMVQWGGG
jgi:putative inorganic carbon (HCO3(-)) transporter